jgi:hypothetical protein
MERIMLKSILILFGAFFILGPQSPAAQSVSEEEALYNALAKPEARKIIKREIQSWSKKQEAVFKRELESRIEAEFIPTLPMMMNEYTAWNDLRISNNRLSLTVQFSDEATGNPGLLRDYFASFDNYICSTPVNILFMLLGYSISSSFYDSSGGFMRTRILSKEKCDL